MQRGSVTKRMSRFNNYVPSKVTCKNSTLTISTIIRNLRPSLQSQKLELRILMFGRDALDIKKKSSEEEFKRKGYNDVREEERGSRG